MSPEVWVLTGAALVELPAGAGEAQGWRTSEQPPEQGQEEKAKQGHHR